MSLSVTVHGIETSSGPTNNGRWATTDITTTDGSDTVVYTIPLTIDYAIAAISICNRADQPTGAISVAIAEADIPLDREFIEWQTIIIPKGVLEITQLMLEPDTRIIVRAE